MKLFEKVKSWFEKSPQPTDLMLGLEYEHEDPMLDGFIHASFPFNRNPEELVRPKVKQSSKKKKVEEDERVPFAVIPDGVPAPRDYDFTLRNLSAHSTAINIDVLPMEIKIPKLVIQRDGTQKREWFSESIFFSPDRISSLGPGKSVKLKVECRMLGAAERSFIPRALHLASDPTDMNELFDDYKFYVVIFFRSTDGRQFAVQQEIVFRPWKNKTTMGIIERTEIFKNG